MSLSCLLSNESFSSLLPEVDEVQANEASRLSGGSSSSIVLISCDSCFAVDQQLSVAYRVGTVEVVDGKISLQKPGQKSYKFWLSLVW